MPSTGPPPLAFEDGGLPERARDRITRAAAQQSHFFTSTFTAAEMAIARLAGYLPLGQVMGSSMYHLGWNSFGTYAGGELEAISSAKQHARDLALSRMRQEAALLGAHAVVGVELKVRGYEWAGELSEFTAIGTAVRTDGPAPSQPALSNITVQDLYKLELADRWPVDVVMGACTYYDPHADCQSDGSWMNQELPDHTRCIDQARATAAARFQKDVARTKAIGAVAVKVERHFHERHYESNKTEHTTFKAEVLLIGTAITSRGTRKLPRPRLVLDLGARQIDLGARAARAEFTLKKEEE